MPQNNYNKGGGGNTNKKKKKGRAPAHQNTFAFKHNPKSKKTAKILELPNVHVCRRCHEKIEWRKRYRKYKPRTQPGKCNICNERRVMAAYHTICEKCTLSDRAKKIVGDHHLLQEQQPTTTTTTNDAVCTNSDFDDDDETVEMAKGTMMQEAEEENLVGDVEEEIEECDKKNNNTEPSTGETKTTTTCFNSSSSSSSSQHRACAMCVKEFALPDPNEQEKDAATNLLNSGKRLTLRQRKTLERQKAAAAQRNNNNKKKKHSQDDDNSSNDDPAAEDDDDELHIMDMDTDTDDDDDDDENDPFLKAVGGANKLLTGEAYQRALLQKEEEVMMA